jgi:hypothetical protein
MESTLLHSFLKAGNLKRWLAKPDCPPVIKECKILFDKIYAPKVAEGEISVGDMDSDHHSGPMKTIPEDLCVLLGSLQHKAIMCARLHHNGVIYTTSNTHMGNSLVYFHPQGNRSLRVPGSIKYIYQEQGRFVLAVQRQLPTSGDNGSDPYAIYPHFPAKLYSSQLSVGLERVQTDWIYSHYARWKLSATQSVVLSLSRVCYLKLLHFYLDLIQILTLRNEFFFFVNKHLAIK